MTSAFPLKIRFRPECQHDVESLFNLRGGSERFASITPEPADGDVAGRTMFFMGERAWEIEIVSAGDMIDLIASMAEVSDGHRMLQTVDLAEHYTGIPYEGAQGRSERMLSLIEGATARVVDAYMEVQGLSSSSKMSR